MEWLDRVLSKMLIPFEIICIDDGSTDNSWEVLKQLKLRYPAIRGYQFLRNYGKSAALATGFRMSKGEVVITMDADLQDSPDEVPELYRMIREEKYDLVSGWKKKRHDPLNKTIPSRIFNGVTRLISGIRLHDFNCGLKAYRSRVVKSIRIYGEMHRYIPVIAKWNRFRNIGEKVVQHRPRKYGVTKYGWTRFITGFLDLLSITFVTRFSRSPMHFFGVFGALSFIVGAGITIYLIWEKIHHINHNLPVRDIVDQPLFFLALVALIIGVQLFLSGFLAELMVKSNTGEQEYRIAEEI